MIKGEIVYYLVVPVFISFTIHWITDQILKRRHLETSLSELQMINNILNSNYSVLELYLDINKTEYYEFISKILDELNYDISESETNFSDLRFEYYMTLNNLPNLKKLYLDFYLEKKKYDWWRRICTTNDREYIVKSGAFIPHYNEFRNSVTEFKVVHKKYLENLSNLINSNTENVNHAFFAFTNVFDELQGLALQIKNEHNLIGESNNEIIRVINKRLKKVKFHIFILYLLSSFVIIVIIGLRNSFNFV